MDKAKYIVIELPVISEGEKEPQLIKIKMLKSDIGYLKEVAWDSYNRYLYTIGDMERFNLGIEHLNLSVRTYNLLYRKEINTVKKLLNKGIKGLRKEKGIGDKTIKEILDALSLF